MIKNIFVALDGTSSSVNSRKTAIEVAKGNDASSLGTGLLDVPVDRGSPDNAYQGRFLTNV